MKGIKMDSEKTDPSVACLVCKHFIVATHSDVRTAVWNETRNLGLVDTTKVKKSLCAKHREIGFAPSHTVGRPAAPDAPEEEEVTSPPLLPTFLDTINGRLIHWKNHKWSWTLHYRRFLRRNNRQN
ncbi:MAG: hypothetical protein [Circular genetic element sp.]|nr:MAG: hypothetical protein [Circular genetic element sp.]